MSPKYKLTYFDGRGLAEVTRLLFAYKGVEYEDVRIQREKWPELKPSTTFGQIPILEVDGHTIAQSRAIARFVAKELGIAGKNNIEAAECDMVVDAVYDAFSSVSAYRNETDETRKGVIYKKFVEETFPNLAASFEKILKANGKGVFVGDSVTWADIAVAHFLWSLYSIKHEGHVGSEEMLDKFPIVKEHVSHTLDLPTIKKWIEKRPVTEF